MVDQGNRLWLWSDKTVSTFALRVANAYWSDRSGPKTVICKTQEPDSFKALFAKWDDFADESDGNELIAVKLAFNPTLEFLKQGKVNKTSNDSLLHYDPFSSEAKLHSVTQCVLDCLQSFIIYLIIFRKSSSVLICKN